MLSPEWKGKATATSKSAGTPSSFSIFACLDGVTQANSDLIDEAALEDQMQEVSDFLLQNTSFSDRRAYRECPEASRMSVYSLIEKQGAELAKATDVRSSQQRDYEDQIDVFNAADLVFRFFFPPQVEVPTVTRYWGAIQLLIEVSRGPLYKLMQESPNNRGQNWSSDEADDERNLRQVRPQSVSKSSVGYIRYELRKLTIVITSFNEIFAHAQTKDRLRITVPDKLIGAWIHLLMGLIYLPKDLDKSERRIDDAKSLLYEGINTIVMSLSEKSLLENSVVLPLEIVALMSLTLLQDITQSHPDISKTYYSYLSAVVSVRILEQFTVS